MKHIKVICDMSWPIKNLLYCLVCGMAKGGEGRKKEIGRGGGQKSEGMERDWEGRREEMGGDEGRVWEGKKEERDSDGSKKQLELVEKSEKGIIILI